MTDNATNDVYKDIRYALADQYIAENNLTDLKDIQRLFKDMLSYIADRTGRIKDKYNVPELEYIFNIYIRLCMKYSVNPSMIAFSIFIGYMGDNAYSGNGGNGKRVTPEFTQFIKKASNTCKQILTENLANTPGASVNQIFVAKAVYGLSDTPERNITEHHLILSADNLPKLSVTRGQIADSSADQNSNDY